MQKMILLMSIAMAVISCQPKPKAVPVDMDAEKAAVNDLIDHMNAAFDSCDVPTLVSYYSDDLLCCGTDPSEFWDKKEITELWNQMLVDTTDLFDMISDRVVKIASNGQSAVAVEQYIMPGISPNIPWRNTYHLIKKDGKWEIFFFSVGIYS